MRLGALSLFTLGYGLQYLLYGTAFVLAVAVLFVVASALVVARPAEP